MTRKFTFGKQERLKSRKVIDSLFKEGKRFGVGPCRVFYRSAPGKGLLQCGFGISKKYFPKAVDRNRVKRRMREAWRLQKNELRDQALQNHRDFFLFIIYQSKEDPPLDALMPVMERIIQKAAREINTTHT